MNYLKKISVSTGISFCLFFIFIFLLTLLQYTGIISNNILKIIFIFITFLSFLIGGILFGKKCEKKGWLEGIKLSIINIILILTTSLIFNNINIKSSILYLILFLGFTIGSIIGVNVRKA